MKSFDEIIKKNINEGVIDSRGDYYTFIVDDDVLCDLFLFLNTDEEMELFPEDITISGCAEYHPYEAQTYDYPGVNPYFEITSFDWDKTLYSDEVNEIISDVVYSQKFEDACLEAYFNVEDYDDYESGDAYDDWRDMYDEQKTPDKPNIVKLTEQQLKEIISEGVKYILKQKNLI